MIIVCWIKTWARLIEQFPKVDQRTWIARILKLGCYSIGVSSAGVGAAQQLAKDNTFKNDDGR